MYESIQDQIEMSDYDSKIARIEASLKSCEDKIIKEEKNKF